jgi:hypothetical protein
MGIQVDSNPSMQTKWTAVALKIPAHPGLMNFHASHANRIAVLTQVNQDQQIQMGLVEQAKEWCLTATHGRWSYQIGYFGAQGHCHIFRFKGPRDAFLFKLTWGGA